MKVDGYLEALSDLYHDLSELERLKRLTQEMRRSVEEHALKEARLLADVLPVAGEAGHNPSN